MSRSCDQNAKLPQKHMSVNLIILWLTCLFSGYKVPLHTFLALNTYDGSKGPQIAPPSPPQKNNPGNISTFHVRMFHTEDPKQLGVTVQNLDAWETWRPGFVH